MLLGVCTIVNSYRYIKSLTMDQQSIERIVHFLGEKNLLSNQQMKLLERPGQSNKFPVSVCINCMREHIPELSTMVIDDAASESLFGVVSDEVYLLSLLKDASTASRILSSTGVACDKVNQIRRLESNLSYPHLMSTVKGDFFLKYNSALGDRYIPRYDPKEVVFQNLLVENVLREYFGDEFTTKTLYPSFSTAENRRRADDSHSELERLTERAIIQPSYSPEFILLSESDDFSLIGKVTGNLVARIFNEAAGFRWSGLLEKYQNEVRDRTWEEFKEWLNNQSWIKKRYGIMMNSEREDLKPFIEEAKKLKLDWEDVITKSYQFWDKGRILTVPDLRPKNTFYHELKGTRIFDFDYLAIQEPSFFAAMVMYFCVKDATDRNISDSDKLTEMASAYLNELITNLEKSRFDDSFRKNITQYFAFTIIARYLPDYIASLATYEKMKSVFHTAKSMLVG